MDKYILFVTRKNVTKKDNEIFMFNELKKHIKVRIMSYDYFVKNLNRFKIMPISILLSLKQEKVYIKLLRQIFKNIKICGYTFDLIDYNEARKNIMVKNISNFDISFIVEKSKYLTQKSLYIFNPVKCFSYTVKQKKTDFKIVHFGRINNKRLNIIISISNIPGLKIELYNTNMPHKNILKKYKNIKIYNGIFDNRYYDITNYNNTFLLSINEVTDFKYYSNRLTTSLGYRCCILQEYFKDIYDDFDENSIIIWKNTNELIEKINNIKNNFSLQNKLRENAYELSKKYTYNKYINFIYPYII
jgi:hypothetical protein